MEPQPKGIIGKSFLFPNLPQEVRTCQNATPILLEQVQEKTSHSPVVFRGDIFFYLPKTAAPEKLP